MSDASKIDDGGAAFAMPASEHSQGGHFEQRGLSRRDYFAAAALTGICANSYTPWSPNIADIIARIATSAYELADAMIAASKSETQS